ncbi:MAG: excinuclease ABC subunit UvrA [Alphaproteobacteria bacterium]|nr:excinuclease ABC subunit UvrA [Alphaproteobacteria bacterium]
MTQDVISIRGAKQHNLKNVDLDIPKNQLVVITGLSGSGKSSLAFDTLYAEGQRRYVESLSAYARQFLNIHDKPDVESIEGLSPAIAIDQKTTSKNPRSTVGTVTEIYDYLRLLYARAGIPYSPATGLPIESQTVSQMVDAINALPEGSKLHLLAPITRGQKGEHRKELMAMSRRGFTRAKIDGEIYELADLPTLDKNKKHDIAIVVDRIKVGAELGNRLADSIETALAISEGLLQVEIVGLPETQEKPKKDKAAAAYSEGQILTFSAKFSCPVSGFMIDEIEPRIFSFNSPFGACPTCDGLGTQLYFDEAMIVPDANLSLGSGAIAPWATGHAKFYQQALDAIARHYKFSMSTPFRQLPEDIQQKIIHGTGEEAIKIAYFDGARTFHSNKPFEGVVGNLQRRYAETESDSVRADLSRFQSSSPCETCHGARLKPESLCVRIGDKNISEVTSLPIDQAVEWFEKLPKKLSAKQNQIAEKIFKEIKSRLGFLQNVGLDYLTLSRESGTLSGGESQRIRLASQIGSGLSGVVYVLDEPSIGLHQCDNERLLKTLEHLRALGNTVIVVEHDEDTMRHADYLIDMGPGAGIHGGHVIAQGTPAQVMATKKSITGQYLSGLRQIDVPKQRRIASKSKRIVIHGARANNLRGIDVAIPHGLFTCVTGVSGGGKSSLVIQTLYKAVTKRLHGTKVTPGAHDSIEGLEHIDKIIEIDQSPIGRTPRSNPVTYTGAFQPIRDWFAGLPESRQRGYQAGRFSFNVKGGRCEACQGDGLIKIEMHFLPDVYVTCDQCKGQRYNRETLEVKYKDKSIADVLHMTVDEASDYFINHPTIREKLLALSEVGLGYIRLGQSATTLSGGEAQRIKLAKELSKRATGKTLYILDEPTTGLHSEDIKKLLHVLHKLVDAGNTMVVIEHNLDVIKTCDHIVDIGPGGGNKGGYLVAMGTPEQVAAEPKSVTGKYLKPLLEKPKATDKKSPAAKKPGAKTSAAKAKKKAA